MTQSEDYSANLATVDLEQIAEDQHEFVNRLQRILGDDAGGVWLILDADEGQEASGQRRIVGVSERSPSARSTLNHLSGTELLDEIDIGLYRDGHKDGNYYSDGLFANMMLSVMPPTTDSYQLQRSVYLASWQGGQVRQQENLWELEEERANAVIEEGMVLRDVAGNSEALRRFSQNDAIMIQNLSRALSGQGDDLVCLVTIPYEGLNSDAQNAELEKLRLVNFMVDVHSYKGDEVEQDMEGRRTLNNVSTFLKTGSVTFSQGAANRRAVTNTYITAEQYRNGKENQGLISSLNIPATGK